MARTGAIGAVAVAWALLFTGPAAAQTVATATVLEAAGVTGFTLSGHLQALQQSAVSAQVAGTVLLLAVKAGDRVSAGQMLARIDARGAQAGLAAATAGVAQAEARQRQAELNLERTRSLQRQNFVSQAALDDAETGARAAAAALEQARAGRAQAALERGFADVVAPFGAVVQATLVEAGDLATPGRPLLTLFVPGRLRAVVEVPASRSALARAATTVEVRLPDGRWVVPQARTELPSADAVSQTVEWRLDLPAAPTDAWAPGQAVQVRFQGAPLAGVRGARPRPVLPVAAVLQRGELSAVYVVHDGRFVLRPVRLGARQGPDGVEVVAGLKSGERYALDAVRAGLAQARPETSAPAKP